MNYQIIKPKVQLFTPNQSQYMNNNKKYYYMSKSNYKTKTYLKMVDFNSNTVGSMIGRQKYVIPVCTDITFRVCGLQTNAQTR